MRVLGIETSCDETGIAIYDDEKGLLANQLYSQVKLHADYGGVVPELASRDHVRKTVPLIQEALKESGLTAKDIDAVAYTAGPGLVGALLVGATVGRSLAFAWDVPAIPVHHMEGHLLAPMLEDNPPEFPFVALLVSGGHTHIYRVDAPESLELLGHTLDDAAGEACDKFAKMLGLPYPGGVLLDRLAQRGAADAHLFPRPYTHVDNLDFSFSGLKTAALTYLNEHPVLVEEGRRVREAGTDSASPALCDVCASYMLAVAETLSLKMEKAFHRERQKGITGIVVAGGVAANTQEPRCMSLPRKWASRFCCHRDFCALTTPS